MSRTAVKTPVSRMGMIRLNSTHAYVEDKSQGPMLRYQNSLPRLPVPSLEETAARYLRSVKAVATADQYARTEQAVKKFLQSEGPALQKQLEARAADPNMKNWLAEWWNNGAYLDVRDPVVPYVSYFYSHKDDKLRKKPAARAASLTSVALTFKDQVDNKTLEPEYMKKNPICMDAYKYMFNTCRIPVQGGTDYPETYSAKDNQYILAIRKNRFFKIYHDVNGQRLSAGDLEKQFEQVYQLADTRGPAIGALTSWNRDKWGAARTELLSAGNKEALKAIEAASFVVCLDDAAPVTREERAHQYWHGDGKNRFYDKPVQFIVNNNGTSGFMGEHSMMDGTQTHRLNDYTLDAIFNNKVEISNKETGSYGAPEEIKFNVNGRIEALIDEAIADFDAEIGAHELAVFNYQGYGKGLMKKFKCSPDAYLQMIIQLAYYKMFGVSRPTYESAATRRFALGRTETCRSVSLESIDFVKTMEDPTASAKEKVEAARKAISAHGKTINDASAGHGVDRHLFGLKKFVKAQDPLPELYQDPMYSFSCSWYLSTSQLSSEYYNGYGWSQVIDPGFGCAYMINENNININIVSKKQGSEKLRFYLNEAADDLAAVFSTELSEAPKL